MTTMENSAQQGAEAAPTIEEMYANYKAMAEDSDDLRLASSAEELVHALALLAGIQLAPVIIDDGPSMADILDTRQMMMDEMSWRRS